MVPGTSRSRHRITVGRRLLRYTVGGRRVARLPTPEVRQLLLRRNPRISLLIIGAGDAVIEIDQLEDVVEYEDLYDILLEELARLGR